MDNIDLKRISWKCRRGTRELDHIVQRWFLEVYPSSNPAVQRSFEDFLNLPDPTIWSWLTGKDEPTNTEWRVIISQMQKTRF